MSNLLLYLLEVSALLTILYGCYFLLLRKETFFGFNRFFLLGILVFSFLFPYISFDLFNSGDSVLNEQVVELGNVRQAYSHALANWSNQQSFDSNSNQFWSVSFWYQDWNTQKAIIAIATMIYLCGLMVFLFRLVSAYRKVFKLKRALTAEDWHGVKVAKIPQDMAPFSFMNTAFIPREISDQSEYDQILAHEKTHVQQRHSIDLIFVQMLAAILWFHPAMWLLIKSLKQTHEYIADRNMLRQGFSLVEYQALLLRQLISNNSYGLVHNFNFSFIKKRITMMSIKESGWTGKSKAIVALSLTLLMGMMTAQSNALLNVPSFDFRTEDNKTEMQFFVDGIALKEGLKFSEIGNLKGLFKFEIDNNKTDRIHIGLELIRKGQKVAYVSGTLEETNTLKIGELLQKAEVEDYVILDIIDGPSEVVKLYKFPLFRESTGWKKSQASDFPPPPVALFVDGVEVNGQKGIALSELRNKKFDVELEYVLSEFVDYDVLKEQAGDVTTNLVRNGKALKSIVTSGIKKKDAILLKDLLELAKKGDAIVIQIGDPEGFLIEWMFMLE